MGTGQDSSFVFDPSNGIMVFLRSRVNSKLYTRCTVPVARKFITNQESLVEGDRKTFSSSPRFRVVPSLLGSPRLWIYRSGLIPNLQQAS